MTVIVVPPSRGGCAKSEQGLALLTVLLIMFMMAVKSACWKLPSTCYSHSKRGVANGGIKAGA